MNSELMPVAGRIKVFFCDSDGVLFPNTVLMGAPYKAKHRSYYDGQGISLLRAIGIRVVFITNEKDVAAAALRETVSKLNGLPSSKPQSKDGWEEITIYEGYGGKKKVEAAQDFLEKTGLTFEEAAYMGDDLVDAELLRKVALPAAPAQAEKSIKEICHFIAEREGGAGAIRDFANMILAARGIDPFSLDFQ